MDFDLKNFINSLPRPFLVLGVLVLGVGFVLLVGEKASVCDSQFNVFEADQGGALYKKKVEKRTILPSYRRSIVNCKRGNSIGACNEYFNLLKKFLIDIQGIGNECGEMIDGKDEVMRVFRDGMALMTEIAWKDQKPMPGTGIEKNWLDAPEVAVFCGLKDNWLRFFNDPEKFEELKTQILSRLPIEARKYEVQTRISNGAEPETVKPSDYYEAVCINCDSIKLAKEEMTIPEIQSHSLFGLRCDGFR